MNFILTIILAFVAFLLYGQFKNDKRGKSWVYSESY